MLFDDFKVISIYTDTDATEDGILVDVTQWSFMVNGKPVNRMTSTVREWFKKDADTISRAFQKEAGIEEVGLVQDPSDVTMRFIMKMYADWRFLDDGDGFILVWKTDGKTRHGDLWLVKNEMDGYTVMFPSDY